MSFLYSLMMKMTTVSRKKKSLICYRIMTDNAKLLLKHMQLVILVSFLFMVLHFLTVNKIIM